MIIILLNIVWEKIRSDRKERKIWHLYESKKCFMENKARQKWYRKKKSIELDDYPLECRKEADVELITALLV